MKVFTITMSVRVPDSVNEELLASSIADDAIRGYEDIYEITYDTKVSE